MNATLSVTPLTDAQNATLWRAVCPICQSGRLILGPRGALSRHLLCSVCYTEFCRGPLESMIVAQPVSDERAAEVYGLQE